MAQHNLGTVMAFEITRTLNKRRFWLVTLAVPILLIIVFLLVFLSNSSTDQTASQQKNAHFTFQYVDRSGLVDPQIIHTLGGTKAASAAAGIAAVKQGNVQAFFDFPAQPAKQTVQVYGADKGIFANGQYSSVATSILQRSAQEKIGSATVTALAQGHVPTNTTTYKGGQPAGGLGGVIGGLVFLAIFYVVILLLGNQMLSSTLEEKENRVTEMILTTINPTSLLVGKVVSLFVVGIVQMLVFAIPTAIGYLFFRSTLNIPI